MNIIGGKFRNRRLLVPKGAVTRPTSAIMRKSLFDICRPMIDQAVVLDLFAGSGAIGIEAISRGAAHVTFVDREKDAIFCIKENIKALRVEEQASCILADATAALEKLKKKGAHFDLIYVDPPYNLKEKYKEILHYIDEENLLNPSGLLFIEEAEASSIAPQTLALSHLLFEETRRFGKSLLHKFTRG